MKYTHAGKEKTLALGTYPEVSLSEARDRRDEARRKIRDGIDPVSERQADRSKAAAEASNTFAAKCANGEQDNRR